ncbi:MAG: TlpA disulfide reductase family protein [Deltaproteobacteria bacterium]
MQEENADKESGLPRFVVPVIVAVIVAAVVLIVLSGGEKYEPVVAGKDAIDFTLPDLKGNLRSLKDFRGKVVFLNFWATWCKPCEQEMPSMQALYESQQGRPFEIVAVSIDSEGPEVIEGFLRKYSITFPVLHDRKGALKERYKTTGVPETFIIDQNGVIAEKVWGPRDWTQPGSIQTIIDLLNYGPKTRQDYAVKKP